MCCHSLGPICLLNFKWEPDWHPSSLWWFALFFSQTHCYCIGFTKFGVNPGKLQVFSFIPSYPNIPYHIGKGAKYTHLNNTPRDLRNNWPCLASFLCFILFLITIHVLHFGLPWIPVTSWGPWKCPFKSHLP